MKDFQTNICPNCGSTKFKNYKDLNDEEKILVENLTQNRDFPFDENEESLFCKRCLYEIFDEDNQVSKHLC